MNYELGGRERLRYELWPECSRQETDAAAAKRENRNLITSVVCCTYEYRNGVTMKM